MFQPARWMVVLLAVTLASTLVAPLAWAQQWIEYRPAGAGYRIEFPGQPKPYDDPGGSPRMHGGEFEAEEGRLYYAAVFNDLANPEANPESQLDKARDGSVRGNKGATLRSEQRILIGGVSARRLVIDLTADKMVIVQLMAISGRRLYQAMWTGPLGRENGDDVTRFIGSFAFESR